MITDPSINITHFKTNPLLEKYIRNISLFECKNEISYQQKLTPSAFTYLSYNHKNIPTSRFGSKKVEPKQRLQIAGPKISEEIFVEYNGHLSQILVEFSASGFYYLFHSSPLILVNKLSEVDNFIGLDDSKQLNAELEGSTSPDEQIQILQELLINKVHRALPFIEYIEKALQIIENQKGNINISELVNSLNIGKRQFDRKFREVVGISPKSYSKIVQLHYVIRLMQSKKYASMQDISYQAEFYDHAHFANRFKELTGFTPNEFIKSNKHIALKYFTDFTE